MEEDETLSVLHGIPGGKALIAMCGGDPTFGDAEIVSLHLLRNGGSSLVVELQGTTRVEVTFRLGHCIDVSLSAFSHQNVIGGLRLRHVRDRETKPWEQGLGLVFGSIEIELLACFGATGTLHADVLEISLGTRQT